MSNNNIKIPVEGNVENIKLIDGLYEDMWVGQKLVFSLQSPYPIEEIKLQGYLSNQFTAGNCFRFKVNDIEMQESFEGDQMFHCILPVNIHAHQPVTVTVESEQVLNPKQQGLGGDERDLAFLLLKFEVKQGKTAGEYLKIGMHHQIKGEFEEAVNCYQKAIDWNPNFHWSYMKLGEVLEKLGYVEESKKYISRSIHLNPNLSAFSNLTQVSSN